MFDDEKKKYYSGQEPHSGGMPQRGQSLPDRRSPNVRGIVRHHRRVEDYRAAWGLPDPEADTPPSVGCEHQIRDFDVRLVVESLELEMQKVCHGWLRGRSKQQIAGDEGFSMNKLNRIMRDIAEIFRKNGLNRWIEE